MNVQQRVQQYLGAERLAPIVIKYNTLPADERPFQYCYQHYLGKSFPLTHNKKTTYYQDMTRSLHYLPHLYKTCFLFYPHDRVEGFSVPTLVKSRPIYDYQQSILFNLNYLRHFSDLEKVEDLDIPYEKKKNVLVWRGSDTGYGFGNNIPYRPVSRQTLVEQYASSPYPEIDVGLSSFSNNKNKNLQETKTFQQYVKPKMKIKEMLRHKFILSVEGNDVATNMKWILNSNSVAFCPPFTMNSWILEENLQPYEHYIPVHYDFHDLPEKVEWSIHHPEQCKTISKQAKEYMKQFMDYHQERVIATMILEEYAQNVKIME